MKFKIKNKDETINLQKNAVMRYSAVHPTDHWVNTITGDIVIIQDIHNRIFTVIDNEFYRRASQFDYDRWEHKLRPYSDNAKVFEILRSRHISQ